MEEIGTITLQKLLKYESHTTTESTHTKMKFNMILGMASGKIV